MANDKKKLKRGDLLKLLLEATRENERLEVELASARSLIDMRELAVSDAGNLAEATLKLNGVFESAQAAANQYLVNIQQQYEGRAQIVAEVQAEAEKRANQIETEANARALQVENAARARAQQLEDGARLASEEVKAQIQQELAAAREQATGIGDEARRESERLQEQAQEKAQAIVDGAAQDAAKLEEEAHARAAEIEQAARDLAEKLEQEAREHAAGIEEEAHARAAEIEQEARSLAEKLGQEAREHAAGIEEEARARAVGIEQGARRQAEEIAAEGRERIALRLDEAERVSLNLEQATKARCENTLDRLEKQVEGYNETMREALEALGIDASGLPYPLETPEELDEEFSLVDMAKHAVKTDVAAAAVESAAPDEPAEPAESAGSAEPAEPAEPTEPAEPAEPAESAKVEDEMPTDEDRVRAASIIEDAVVALEKSAQAEPADDVGAEAGEASEQVGPGKAALSQEAQDAASGFFIPRGPARGGDWDSVMSEATPIEPK